tara:strand:+ start:242 stop:523 length:282 start_codon:yes stop_codon:yes gene_type:complete
MVTKSKKMLLISAIIDKYNAQKSEALAHLEILFTNPVGIGEHTDILSEIDKWVNTLSQAEDNLSSLDRYFEEDSGPKSFIKSSTTKKSGDKNG